MKYNEDKILKEVGEYIKSTYGQHYAQVKEGVQVQDLLRSVGIDKDFCQANAIKYLARFGIKKKLTHLINGQMRRAKKKLSSTMSPVKHLAWIRGKRQN